MLYRKMGKSNCEVSVLGFGCMRLPIKGNRSNPADVLDPKREINEEKTIQLINYAIDQEINYFDTAYPYHNGKSEVYLGKAVQKQREKVMITTKLPCWLVKSSDDFDRLFNEQLQRLNMQYLDFYLLHGLNQQTWPRMKELGVLRFLDKILSDRRARYVGFSFHDDVRIFKEIIDTYNWTICQIQYNYLDRNYQAGKQGLEYAASKGIGLVVMEPLRGGRLAEKAPAEVQSIWDSAPQKRSPAEWGLRWVWNHPQVSTALSGMNSMEQLQENIRIATDARPNSLSPEELALIDQVTDTYKKLLQIDCTACGYCMPCPQGVDIPQNFRLYNDLYLFKQPEYTSFLFNRILSSKEKAANCSQCGECEERCPRNLNIREELEKVKNTFVS